MFRKRGRRLKDMKFKRWKYLKGILVKRFSFDSVWSLQRKSWRSWRVRIIKAGFSNDWESLTCAPPTGAGCGDATVPGYPIKLTRGVSVTLRITLERRGRSWFARGASRTQIPVMGLLCFVLLICFHWSRMHTTALSFSTSTLRLSGVKFIHGAL